MPNRQYEQGTRFEHKVIADLESRGFVTVRAAGSKGAGKVDVIAVRAGELTGVQRWSLKNGWGPAMVGSHHLWIQCKRTGVIPPAEWNRLYEVAHWALAVPVLAENGPAGRGVTYRRLDAQKVPGSRVRPYSVLELPPKLTASASA
jgi:Archaeal holliday junction resolvase (hjc)